MINKIKDWLQVLRLAKHIHANLPPKDGEYHSVSFNIKLKPPNTEQELKK